MTEPEMKLAGADLEISVGLFPGQGSYYRNCLRDAWLSADGIVQETFTTIDEAASKMFGKNVTQQIFQPDPPSLDELFATAPDVLQLAILGASASTFGVLSAHRAAPSVLLGHSLGEIAALVCGGAFSLQDGAAILCHRISALQKLDTSDGLMLSLACGPERTEQILALVADPQITVAVENSPQQTVVSGPRLGVGKVREVAKAIGLGAATLRSPHPFHNTLLTGAKEEMVQAIRHYPQRPFTKPVFSPILGRFYRDEDDLAELLGRHLIQPVRFGQAVRRFYDHGARIFVEMGPGTTLTDLVRRTYPDVTVLAPLDRPERDGLAQAAAFLARGSSPRTELAPGPHQSSTPTPAAVDPVPVPAMRVMTVSPANRPASPTTAEATPGQLVPKTREALFAEIRTLYAAALEYPEEVFEEDVLLEAELGVDSVKQTELIRRLQEKFGLEPAPEAFRLADYDTFGKVVGLVAGAPPARK